MKGGEVRIAFLDDERAEWEAKSDIVEGEGFLILIA